MTRDGVANIADWYTQDDAFYRELTTGRRMELAVAVELLDLGYAVQVGRAYFRNNIEDWQVFVDQVDIELAAHINGNRILRFEVRSRNLAFTSPDDYPYPTAIVTEVANWERKTQKPHATILISQKTGGRLIVPSSSAPTWKRDTKYDGTLKADRVFYTVERGGLKTWPWFIDMLAQRTAA